MNEQPIEQSTESLSTEDEHKNERTLFEIRNANFLRGYESARNGSFNDPTFPNTLYNDVEVVNDLKHAFSRWMHNEDWQELNSCIGFIFGCISVHHISKGAQ